MLDSYVSLGAKGAKLITIFSDVYSCSKKVGFLELYGVIFSIPVATLQNLKSFT